MTLREELTGNRLRLAALTYHDVGEPQDLTGLQVPTARAYRLSFPQFSAHLHAMEEGPLKPRTVFDPAIVADRCGLLLTFDDGGKSAMPVADLLDARGWKGHFFVATGLIGTLGFMTRSDILDLHRRGHVIGSHSHRHPNICYNLLEAEMFAEWNTSCSLLADLLGEPIVTASVPGGDMGRQTVSAAAKAGIEYLFTSEPTLQPWLEVGIACFGRVSIDRNTDRAMLEQFIRFKGYRKRMAVRHFKQLIKKLIAPLYRRSIPQFYGNDDGSDMPIAKNS